MTAAFPKEKRPAADQGSGRGFAVSGIEVAGGMDVTARRSGSQTCPCLADVPQPINVRLSQAQFFRDCAWPCAWSRPRPSLKRAHDRTRCVVFRGKNENARSATGPPGAIPHN